MKRPTATNNFGRQLAQLRRARGLTQQELGDKIEVSKRVIAYYEGESQYPPTHLLVPLAKALNVSADELLGIKSIKQELDPEHASLWRRLKKAELLSKQEQKALLHYLNAMLRAKAVSQEISS